MLALGQGVPDKPIKPIRSVVDREPVITDREIRLALWMRERYFCTFYDAIRTILPAAVWYSYREMWSLTGEPLPEDLSEREAAACRLLQDGPMERDDLCAALGETGGRVLSALKSGDCCRWSPRAPGRSRTGWCRSPAWPWSRRRPWSGWSGRKIRRPAV